MKHIGPYRLGLALGLVAATVVGVFSLVPLESLPPEPGTGEVRWFTRLHHIVAYFGIVFPVVAARPQAAIWAVPAVIGYGGMIEIIQPHVGRSGAWLDFWANAFGAGLGAIAAWAAHRLLVAPLLRRTGQRP